MAVETTRPPLRFSIQKKVLHPRKNLSSFANLRSHKSKAKPPEQGQISPLDTRLRCSGGTSAKNPSIFHSKEALHPQKKFPSFANQRSDKSKTSPRNNARPRISTQGFAAAAVQARRTPRFSIQKKRFIRRRIPSFAN